MVDRGESFESRCRRLGLRVTPQRVAIYEELCKASDHPTADRVYSKIRRRFPTISFNTVNETLLTFSRIGLLDVVEGTGDPRRFDPVLTPHHHAYCTSCGAIEDFTHKGFDFLRPPKAIAGRFEVTGSRVVFSGSCAKCRRTAPKDALRKRTKIR